jgi:hypothetical protein
VARGHTIAANSIGTVEVPDSEDMHLSAIAVKDSTSEYSYRERFTNALPNEKVFHVESNDYDKVFVRFGVADVVGVQPMDGAILTLTVSYSHGDVSIAPSIDYLRDLCRYPSV